MPIVVHLARPSAPCRAVLMTARELGLEVVVKEVDLRNGEQRTPEYLKMNPQHTVPTLDDNGFYLWESRAIITYLANKYGPNSPLYPKDPKKRAEIDRMLYFDIGTLYKAQGEYIYPQMLYGKEADPEKEAVFRKALDLLEVQLGKNAYAAGSERTLADLSILAGLTFLEIKDYDLSGYPKIVAWIKKLKAELPYYEELNDVPLKHLKEVLKKPLNINPGK